jgi:hypothetical protein
VGRRIQKLLMLKAEPLENQDQPDSCTLQQIMLTDDETDKVAMGYLQLKG